MLILLTRKAHINRVFLINPFSATSIWVKVEFWCQGRILGQSQIMGQGRILGQGEIYGQGQIYGQGHVQGHGRGQGHCVLLHLASSDAQCLCVCVVASGFARCFC